MEKEKKLFYMKNYKKKKVASLTLTGSSSDENVRKKSVKNKKLTGPRFDIKISKRYQNRKVEKYF